MTIEVIIGIGGLVLCILTYFAGLQRTKRRYEKDASENRINKVVDEYQKLFQAREDYGIPALMKAGVLLLQNEKEIRETCCRLELRNGCSPLKPHVGDLETIDLMKFFQTIRDHKLNPVHHDFFRLAKEKMKLGE